MKRKMKKVKPSYNEFKKRKKIDKARRDRKYKIDRDMRDQSNET